MRNRLKVVSVLASMCVIGALSGVALAADQPPQPSKGTVKILKAAQDAIKEKKLDEALTHLKEAQTVPDRTAYDNFVINQDLLYIYVQKQDYAAAAPILESTAQSPYAKPEDQKAWLKALFAIDYQQKDYQKTVDVGEQLIKRGISDAQTLSTIAEAQKQLGKFKDAAATVDQIVSHQEKPEEELLRFQWTMYDKVKDEADAAKVLEKLVSYYPKPDYWAGALGSLLKMDIKDSHLQLNVYRLENDVGVLKRPADFADMAELGLDAGFPGETVAVLEEAFQKGVFTEQRDKDRYQHLLDGAKQRAASDQQSLGRTEPVDGNACVQLGAAYMSYGQYDKAVANISKGLQKGGLKSVDEANLLLGIAFLRQKNNSEATKAFDKVASSSNPGYARLGKLWALRAGQRSA
ncbi:MAG TPA: tetratricopeptide repeat protein [Steroidobacteraceae bacterium]|jgi:Tfp pilus assembly protein PilF|nr:tetratricopeptide repeat protein [Steroidobacteraceae bacterium]